MEDRNMKNWVTKFTLHTMNFALEYVTVTNGDYPAHIKHFPPLLGGGKIGGLQKCKT
jgi:hypothetical protein